MRPVRARGSAGTVVLSFLGPLCQPLGQPESSVHSQANEADVRKQAWSVSARHSRHQASLRLVWAGAVRVGHSRRRGIGRVQAALILTRMINWIWASRAKARPGGLIGCVPRRGGGRRSWFLWASRELQPLKPSVTESPLCQLALLVSQRRSQPRCCHRLDDGPGPWP